MRQSQSVFLIDKSHLKQKALTVRIPLHLYDALNSMRVDADKAGLVFDVQAVVVQALTRALASAQKEMATRHLVKPPSSPEAARPTKGQTAEEGRGVKG